MKVRVRIEDRTFMVEIEDPNAEPVVAVVDGQRLELWPESGPRLPKVTSGAGAPAPFSADREVRAPIPGVILSVAVQAGASVAPGQELCVLEAMKMRNPICAGRAGILQAVHIRAGDHVQHRQVLMEYAGEGDGP